MKWRWYHFYFLLAIFDLVVIVASLALLHRTIRSYEVALSRWETIDAKQRWIAILREGLIALNAPGNDVFAQGEVDKERKRFEGLQLHLDLLMRRETDFGVDLTSFRDAAKRMVAEETSIFEQLAVGQASADESQRKSAFQRASVAMAAMDRAQALAVNELSVIDRKLLSQTQVLLLEYKRALERSAWFEKCFSATVALAVVGMFWFGRKLQQNYDRMMADQERVVRERHERLAAVGEVCSAVAHGIRNPLAAISSSAQLALRFGTLDDATRLRVQDVLTEARRLDKRVNRLLDFSRASKQPLEPFRLQDAIDQAVHEVKPRLDEQNTRVTKHLTSDALMIHGHRERMIQAIIEVLSNSMDHMSSGGDIELRCRRENGATARAVLDIIDTGPGIAAQVRERVFDLFFTSRADGHGIGLASVARAVEFHGGSVRVVERQERGAHIEIALPLTG